MKSTMPLKVVVGAWEQRGGGLSSDKRHERSIEGYVDEAVGGDGPLDTSDEAVLPEKFSWISPSEPRKGRRETRLREGH